MVSSHRTFVNRLQMSREQRNDLAGSRLQFWMKVATVKESCTQCEENNFRTGIIGFGPTDSQRPRMYGLPKTHKENIPLRPVLSMIGSSQHELAKWLAEISYLLL